MLIVEVGIKLDRDFHYYDKMLRNNGMINDFSATIHDLYYTNQNLDGLTEKGMKNACIRLRSCGNTKYVLSNNQIHSFSVTEISDTEIYYFEKQLSALGYRRVFDTLKNDFYYCKDGINSKIQLQEIADVGLLVYYDNEKYYALTLETQRKMLIDELNTYGFTFTYDMLGLDKLRTLYYGKEMFSLNQNG